MASAKPATYPLSSAVGGGTHPTDDAGRPERDEHVPGLQLHAQHGRSVVPGARPEHRTATLERARRFGRAEHARCARPRAERQLEQVVAVLAGAGRPVAGAAGVAAVGDELAAPTEAPRQPVVRQADRRRAGRVVGLGVGEPAQLGHGQGRDEHGTDRVRPRLATAVQLGGQLGGGVRRTQVVPEQGVADDGTVLSEADHAVLLRTDRDPGDVVQATGRGDRLLQRVPPCVRVAPPYPPGAARNRTGPAHRCRRRRHGPCRTAWTSPRLRPDSCRRG